MMVLDTVNPLGETMSTPTKQTPTKTPVTQPEKTKRARVTEPLRDYSAVTAEDVDSIAVERSSVVDKTPFPAMIADSWAARTTKEVRRNVNGKSVLVSVLVGKAKAVTVRSDSAKQVTSLLRASAARAGVGVRFGKPQTLPNGGVRITFQAQEKKKYSPRKGD